MENDKMEIRNYTSLGAELNVPAELIIGAGLSPRRADAAGTSLELGAELSVLTADGMLLIAAAEPGHRRDLTDALSCVMQELGYDPEDIYAVVNADNGGGNADCAGQSPDVRTYTSLGAEMNIPSELIIGAGIELGAELSVLTADGLLLIAAAESEHLRDLTDELGCFMREQGFEPEETYSVTEADYYDNDDDYDDDDE
jgi:hypothetical protein